jgi:arylsulfatase A-like enzyme
VRKGKWKLVSTYPQYRWELYDIEKDRGETTDIAQQNRQIVNELSASYKKTGVVEYDLIKPKSIFDRK